MTAGGAAARVVATLEQIAGSAAPEEVPELGRSDVKAAVREQLASAGRSLIEHRRDERLVAYASGFDDEVADRLAAEGLGVLAPVDAAVTALVLLHTVAVPTAAGEPPVPWSSAEGVDQARLHDTRSLTKQAVRDAVSRLDRLGVLHNARAAGIKPGPALDRLTDARRRRISVRLLAVAAPDDPLIAGLARDRSAISARDRDRSAISARDRHDSDDGGDHDG